MRIVFFGTSCAIPAPGNGYTSFLLSHGQCRILVDTGDNPVRSFFECGEDPNNLDAVVITHSHVDHMGAFPSLVSALECLKRKKPLQVVAAPDTLKTAQNLLAQFPLDLQVLPFPLHYGSTFHADGISLSLLPGKHTVPTSMVYIRSKTANRDFTLLYTSDYCHGDSVGSPAGTVDVLIHEATYLDSRLPSNSSHSTARQAGIAAHASSSQVLFLCHFEHQAYPDGLESAAIEVQKDFSGLVIVPEPYRWYKISDYL